MVRIGNNSVTRTDLAGQLNVNAESTTNNFSLPAIRGTSGQALVTNGTGASAWTNVILGIKATVNSDVASVAANASLVHTFTVTGAVTTATAQVSPATALADGLIISYVRVSAANTVEVKFRNLTGTAINPAAMNYYITVAQ